MTERVQIIVEAKDATSGVLRGITSQFGALGSIMEDIASPSQNWGNVTADAAAMVARAFKESIDYTVQYANAVHDLSLVSGQGMEASSRFIQVLDDYGLSAEDAMLATRALTKQGFAPTIDTLAQLADQYNELGTAAEKNAFILQNLGRGGMEWAKALSQGGNALKAQFDAVNQANIVTQAGYEKVLQYEVAVDTLTDAWNGFKVELGTTAMPALADAIKGVAIDLAVLQKQSEAGFWKGFVWHDTGYMNNLYDEARAEYDAAEQARLHSAALRDNSVAAGENGGAVNDLAAQLKLESAARQTEISNMFAIQGLYDQTAQKRLDLEKQLAAAQKEGTDARLDWAKGTLTYAEYQERFNEALAKETEIRQQIRGLDEGYGPDIENQQKAIDKMTFSILQQKLAQDGLTAAEEEYLMKIGVQKGLVTQEAANAAIAATQEAENLAGAFAETLPKDSAINQAADRLNEIASYKDDVIPVTVLINWQTSPLTVLGGLPTLPLGGGGGTGRMRAEGGPVSAGQTYWVGERGPEAFVPSANGYIVPHDKAGPTINIYATVTTPTDWDVVAQEVARRIA